MLSNDVPFPNSLLNIPVKQTHNIYIDDSFELGFLQASSLSIDNHLLAFGAEGSNSSFSLNYNAQTHTQDLSIFMQGESALNQHVVNIYNWDQGDFGITLEQPAIQLVGLQTVTPQELAAAQAKPAGFTWRAVYLQRGGSGPIPLRNPRHQRPQQRQIDQQRQRETASSRARRGIGLNQQNGNPHGHDGHHRRQPARHGERPFPYRRAVGHALPQAAEGNARQQAHPAVAAEQHQQRE